MNASGSDIRQPDREKGPGLPIGEPLPGDHVLADPGASAPEKKEKRPIIPPRLTRVGVLPEVTTQLVGTFSP